MIRVTASAAICGLSMSFLAGEIVAAGGGSVRWAPLSSVLPLEFPAARPARELIATLERWDSVDGADDIEAPSQDIVTIEDIRLAEARLPPPVPEERAEVQKELERVHVAAAKVAVVDTVSQRAAAPEEREQAEIRGKILLEGEFGPGHFEVGLFGQIDAKGSPAGFPLAQQILKKDKTEFSLKAPREADEVFLFAQFYPDDTSAKEESFGYASNPIKSKPPGAASYDVVAAPARKAATPARTAGTVVIRGRVAALFAKINEGRVQDAVVRLRGTSYATTTNRGGEFELKIPAFKGTALIEVIKSGFYPAIMELSGEARELERPIEIASREAIDQMAVGLGIRQRRASGIFLIQGPPSLTYQLSLKADGPFYLAPEGHPASGAKQATSDGRAIFFNVEPGVGHFEASGKGDAVAPATISVVDGGGLVVKRLNAADGRIRGRVFNPVAGPEGMKPMAGVRVRVEGATDWAITDSTGAFEVPQTRFFQGETVTIEVSSEKIYHHRFSVKPGRPDLTLFVFPRDYLSRLAASVDVSLDPYSGMVLGGVGKGAALRMDGLADHSEVNNAKDFYFDEKGMLRGGAARTDPAFGTFVIFNVPAGRTLLHGVDSAGAVRHSSLVNASASVVSVVIE
ncbi:MAG: hypothetical protein HUU37_07955 [Bdellovibrionales bacterium]|nr:hypothetical protein [Bdellovibrionales bacterium]